MRRTWKLTVASFKMYFRQREAIIWSFLLPLFVIVLFSFVRFNGMGSITLGVVDESGGGGKELGEDLQKIPALKLNEGTKESELVELEKGERDLVLVVPAGFQNNRAETDTAQGQSIIAYINEGRRQQAQLGVLLVQRALDERTFSRIAVHGRTVVQTQAVKSRDLTYIDYLIPGVISMSIMQMGIFGVAFGFVSLKKRGILRRLSVTPVRPREFIIAQVIMRVAVLMLQIGLMVGVGVFFLHLHFIGSLFFMLLLGVLGAVVFLGMGFAIAGVSNSEDQVAPMANLLSLPMMLLSGVFFSRSNLPGFVQSITAFLPLTPLADAMRSVAIDGSTLLQVGPQILQLLGWGVVTTVVAIRLFRWE
jgi:ABC-2 type transport system permease protein